MKTTQWRWQKCAFDCLNSQVSSVTSHFKKIWLRRGNLESSRWQVSVRRSGLTYITQASVKNTHYSAAEKVPRQTWAHITFKWLRVVLLVLAIATGSSHGHECHHAEPSTLQTSIKSHTKDLSVTICGLMNLLASITIPSSNRKQSLWHHVFVGRLSSSLRYLPACFLVYSCHGLGSAKTRQWHKSCVLIARKAFDFPHSQW